MLNVDSFKNFILMNKNIKKNILDQNLNNQDELFARGIQLAILTLGLSLGLTYIGAPCSTGCDAGVVAGTSIIVANQVGRHINHISLIDKYKKFIGPVADTQSSDPNFPFVRNYLFIQNGETILLGLLERTGTPAVPLGSRWPNPSTASSSQNSMSESGQPNPSTAPIENRLHISSLQAIGDAIGARIRFS